MIYDPTTPLPFPATSLPSVRIDPVAQRIVRSAVSAAQRDGTPSPTGQTIDNYVAIRSGAASTISTTSASTMCSAGESRVRALQPAGCLARDSARSSQRRRRTRRGIRVGAHSIAFNDTQISAPAGSTSCGIGWSAIDLGFVRVGRRTADRRTAGHPRHNHERPAE